MKTLAAYRFNEDERRKMIQITRWAALYLSPMALFVALMFADISILAGEDTDPNKLGKDPTEYPYSQYSYVNVAIDSSLAYRESMMRGGLIYDLTDNKLVWQKNLETAFPIASLTKMMVALITMEQVAAGNITLEEKVTVSREATYVGGSRVYIKEGSKLMVEDLLEACMIRSGNDASYQLAHFIGGTEKAFVEVMNDKAYLLGMETTRFGNSTGMPNKKKGGFDNYSTPADLMLLAKELVKYDGLMDIVSRHKESIRNVNGLYTYANRNTLAKRYTEIDGLKTGYTSNAKYCIVATGQRCGHRVISIVLGVDSKATRSDLIVNMFNNYYNSIGLGELGEDIEGDIVSKDVKIANETSSMSRSH